MLLRRSQGNLHHMAGVRTSKVVLPWVLTLMKLQTAEHSPGRVPITILCHRASTELVLLLRHGWVAGVVIRFQKADFAGTLKRIRTILPEMNYCGKPFILPKMHDFAENA